MLRFRAMGTEVAVSAPELTEAREEDLAHAVAELFAANEARFSRFRPDSELSRLNACPRPMVVSAELFAALRSARQLFEQSGGLLDPTVGGALVALGYDRSFAPGALDRPTATGEAARASFDDVALDEATRTVTRPPHVTLDLGGIVKGRTVDAAAALLPDPGAVDAGGDAVVRGGGAGGTGWMVDVEDPRDPRRSVTTLIVRDGAVATSGVGRRRWRAGSEVRHHLIDPRTGRPAASDLVQVTVVADRAERAEVVAKSVLLAGHRAGRRWLERLSGVGAVLVDDAGAVHRFGDLEETHG